MRTEVIEWIARAGRYVAVLVVVTLASAGAAIAVVSSTADVEYAATSTIPFGRDMTIRQASTAADNVRVTLQSPRVREEVAEAVGATVDEIAEGTSVARLGESDYLDITFTSSDPSLPEPVVTELAQAALVELAGNEILRLESQLEQQQQALDIVEGNLAALRERYDVVSVSAFFETKQQALFDLRDQLDEVDDTELDALRAEIAVAQAEIDDLRTDAAEFTELQAQRRQTSNALLRVESEIEVARANRVDRVVAAVPSDVREVSQTSLIARRAVAAAASAFVVTLGLVLLLDARRRRDDDEPDPSAQDPVLAPDRVLAPDPVDAPDPVRDADPRPAQGSGVAPAPERRPDAAAPSEPASAAVDAPPAPSANAVEELAPPTLVPHATDPDARILAANAHAQAPAAPDGDADGDGRTDTPVAEDGLLDEAARAAALQALAASPDTVDETGDSAAQPLFAADGTGADAEADAEVDVSAPATSSVLSGDPERPISSEVLDEALERIMTLARVHQEESLTIQEHEAPASVVEADGERQS